MSGEAIQVPGTEASGTRGSATATANAASKRRKIVERAKVMELEAVMAACAQNPIIGLPPGMISLSSTAIDVQSRLSRRSTPAPTDDDVATVISQARRPTEQRPIGRFRASSSGSLVMQEAISERRANVAMLDSVSKCDVDDIHADDDDADTTSLSSAVDASTVTYGKRPRSEPVTQVPERASSVTFAHDHLRLRKRTRRGKDFLLKKAITLLSHLRHTYEALQIQLQWHQSERTMSVPRLPEIQRAAESRQLAESWHVRQFFSSANPDTSGESVVKMHLI